MIPNSFVSGDTVRFTYKHPDYPASDGWTLSFTVVNNHRVTVTAVANGDEYTVTIPAVQSTRLTQGHASFAVTVMKNGDRHTLQTGMIVVEEDIATAAQKGLHAEKMLRYIEDVLENRLSSGDALDAISIGGQNLVAMKVPDLLTLKSHYENALAKFTRLSQGASAPYRLTRIQVGRYR